MSFQERYQQLRLQLSNDWHGNKRLQVIVAVSVVLTIVWGHVALERWRAATETQARRTFIELSDTRVAASEKSWPSRAEEVKQQLEKAGQRLWTARTEGEAQAALRDWLQAQASAAGVKIQQITVDVGPVATNGPKFTPVRADFRGVYEVGAWQQLVSRIEQSVPSLVIEFEQIDVSRRPTYRLGVLAWFELSADAPAVGGASSD